MAYYLSSDNVDVFPSVNRANTQLSARQLSEMRISNLITQLVDNNAFVISYDKTNYIMEINIHGYYFKLSQVNQLTQEFSSSDSIYASITLQEIPVDSENSNTIDYIQLQGQDEQEGTTYKYKGISFASTASTDQDTYSLLILHKQASTGWDVPDDSYVKMNSNSISMKVDGGVI